MDNINPTIYFRPVDKCKFTSITAKSLFSDEYSTNKSEEIITQCEIYDAIKDIMDPEYPLTLEQLDVVSYGNITIDNDNKIIFVSFKPTVTNCSQASLIGLSIFFKLYSILRNDFKIVIKVVKGTHDLEDAINKQLKDKERVFAALENPQIFKTITKGLCNSYIWEDDSLLY
ncbi:hypothetical protein FG386_001059 [Cryptosporidium ryanae]|uniref:uncharacterized protein n=1 Tax=Cryptosporidium ryanae TaxID=515981 RepID=UPI003519DFD5|nr:hypothetical protein FG386_001059 [Cryptosporidium ryanae]